MAQSHKITMLGTGFIADFYTATLHGQRGPEQIHMVYSRSAERVQGFQDKWGIPHGSTSLEEAVRCPETDTVIIGLPNNLHEEAVIAAAEAGKAVLCTKPLGRNAEEAKRMLDAVEKAGIFSGYLEDLVYPPKTLKAIDSVKNGALGQILWVRSRETHPGPHSQWFWDIEQAGGGSIIDMGCHCVEIIRNFIGKSIRPVEVMCWADTLVHPMDAEDHGIGLIRFQNDAIGQFEVGWAFRGGMDLRDEISGSKGTIWLNHWLRTGYEMFTSVGQDGYVAEKVEGNTGWLFPVGDEAAELGYSTMLNEMFNCLDDGTEPTETFYDGYVVNAVIDACYQSAQSRKWETIELEDWRGKVSVDHLRTKPEANRKVLLKSEIMPDGRTKQIFKDPQTGKIIEQILESE